MSDNEIMREVNIEISKILDGARRKEEWEKKSLAGSKIAIKKLELLAKEVEIKKDKINRRFFLNRDENLIEKLDNHDDTILYIHELCYDLGMGLDVEELFKHYKREDEYKKYINWSAGDEELEKLIHLLNKYEMIESVDLQSARKHFVIGGHIPADEFKPFNWIHKQINLLAYLLRSLENGGFIKTKNLWQETSHHFEYHGRMPESLRQSEDAYINRTKKGKPRNYKLVDQIISSIME